MCDNLVDAEALEEGIRQRNDLRIRRRRRRAENLNAELMMLSQTSLLDVLIAVVRHDVVSLERQSLGVQGVFQIRTRGGCRALRAQGDGASALVLKGVHFLLHDVRGIADAAVEQLGVLEVRETDLAETILVRDLPEHALYILPFINLGRDDVLGALRGLDKVCHVSFPFVIS